MKTLSLRVVATVLSVYVSAALWGVSDCWASPPSFAGSGPQKYLAPGSDAGAIFPEAKLRYIGDAALKVLLEGGVRNNRDIYRGLVGLRGNLAKNISDVEGIDRDKILWFIFEDQTDPKKKAYYVFTNEGYYLRYVHKGETVADDLRFVLAPYGAPVETYSEVIVSGEIFIGESYKIAEDGNLPLINAYLKTLYNKTVTPITPERKSDSVAQILESIENPYWSDMKQRLEPLRPLIDNDDPLIIGELQEPHDVHHNWAMVQLNNKTGEPYEAKVYRVRAKNNVVLGPAKGGIRYATASELLSEKTGIFKKTLDRLNELGATKEDVEAFVAKWVREEAQALSLGMTLKNAGAALNLGGGKGDVFIGEVVEQGGQWTVKDYPNWRDSVNLARIARSHSRDLAQAGKVGVDIDIPAPDVNTGGNVLAWYEDEYLRYLIEETDEIKNANDALYQILSTALEQATASGAYDPTSVALVEAATQYARQGNPVPWLGVYTGKPVALGGSKGRTEATGFGGVDVMKKLLGDLEGKTVSVQGFGNVGAHVALELARQGAKVQYLNDHTMTLYESDGFSVEALEEMVQWVNTRPSGEALVHYYDTREAEGVKIGVPLGKVNRDNWRDGLDERTRSVLYADVDYLVPAALENQIRADNVDKLNVRRGVIELANGPTNREAEQKLYERGIFVIHDTLANAGGVIVSSIETEQAVEGDWYDADKVGSRRSDTLEQAAEGVRIAMAKYGIRSYRLAGDFNAVSRIVKTKKLQLRSELMQILLKGNVAEKIEAANTVGRLKLTGFEDQLIELLGSRPEFNVIEAVAKSLARLKTGKAVDELKKAFTRNKGKPRSEQALSAIIEALGQSAEEQAMLFLGEQLRDPSISPTQKVAIIKALSFYRDSRAVDFLLEVLGSDFNEVIQTALAVLGQIAGAKDVKKLTGVRSGIITQGAHANVYQTAIDLAIDRIRNRMSKKILVVGSMAGRVDSERFERAYKSMQTALRDGTYGTTEHGERARWKNPEIAARFVPRKSAQSLVEQSVSVIPSGQEHPDVQSLLRVLDEKDIVYKRSRTSVAIQEGARSTQWANDGSVLIPTHDGLTPFALSFEDFPTGGEVTMIPGRNTLLLVAESRRSSIRNLEEKFPDTDIAPVPEGFVTVKLPDGDIALLGTSHINTVINTIPPGATKDGVPIVMVDPRYYRELMLRESTTTLLRDIIERHEAKVVVIPEEEAHLNPVNFMLLNDQKILLNRAPKTRKILLQLGMKEDALIMMDKAVTSLALQGGMIGNLGGIYTEDRVTAVAKPDLVDIPEDQMQAIARSLWDEAVRASARDSGKDESTFLQEVQEGGNDATARLRKHLAQQLIAKLVAYEDGLHRVWTQPVEQGPFIPIPLRIEVDGEERRAKVGEFLELLDSYLLKRFKSVMVETGKHNIVLQSMFRDGVDGIVHTTATKWSEEADWTLLYPDKEVDTLIRGIENPFWTIMIERLEDMRHYIDSEDPEILDELKRPVNVHQDWAVHDFVNEKGEAYKAKVYRVRVKNNTVLGPAKGGMRYFTGSELMSDKAFARVLDKLNDLGATQEEIERFVAKWLRGNAHAAALGMTLKNSGAGLNLGGGKGNVFVGAIIREDGRWILKDCPNWQADGNREIIARSHSLNLAKAGRVGLDIDIPAPDVHTSGDLMAWYADEYFRYVLEETDEIRLGASPLFRWLQKIRARKEVVDTNTPRLTAATRYSRGEPESPGGEPVPWLGVYTGKPPSLGGSKGRAEATGFGGVDVMEAILGEDLEEKTIAIQGFGIVGGHVAMKLAQKKAKVLYINDHTMTLHKKGGFDYEMLSDLAEWLRGHPGSGLAHYFLKFEPALKGMDVETIGPYSTTDWESGLEARTREILRADVDILIPAALENQIREDNVDIIKAKVIVELANGPITKAAENILDRNGRIIIPDTLANAGAVVVSNLETLQAKYGKWLTDEEVGRRRRRILTQAAREVKRTMEERGIGTLRKAGDVYAVLRIVKAKRTPAVESFVRSLENPYWSTMKRRLEDVRKHVDSLDPNIIYELEHDHEIHENWDTMKLENKRGELYRAEIYRVSVRNSTVLGPARGGIRYIPGSKLMKNKVFAAALDRLSELGATKDQVRKFVEKWVREEAQALALMMTLKHSETGMISGGGKAAVFLGEIAKENGRWILKDHKNWRADDNLARVARSHSRDLARSRQIGIDKHIPAPDINTNPQVLAWYADEYLKYLMQETDEILKADPKLYHVLQAVLDEDGRYDDKDTPLLARAREYSDNPDGPGRPVPWLGAYTGKPIPLGGSKGTRDAKGVGAVDVIEAVMGEDYISGKTVSIQGFGNAGAHAALALRGRGAIIQYINDDTITLHKEGGFDIKELDEMVRWVDSKPAGETLVDYYESGKIEGAVSKGQYDKEDWRIGIEEREEAVLNPDVAILVPAAIEGQIHRDNVEHIKAKLIVELADGPVTDDAEEILYSRGTIVIHDTLANAGATAVSGLETEQAITGNWLSDEEVDLRRSNALKSAAMAVRKLREEYVINTLRRAGNTYAIMRIAKAKKERELQEREARRQRDLWKIHLEDGGEVNSVTAIKRDALTAKRKDIEMLERTISKIIRGWGKGLFATLDGIRVVENMDIGKNDGNKMGLLPFAAVVTDNGDRILIIDERMFGHEDLLYLTLNYKLVEEIMRFVSQENEATRDLFTSFSILKWAFASRESRIIDLADAMDVYKATGLDIPFFTILEKLHVQYSEGTTPGEGKLVPALSEVMRDILYYAKAFGEFRGSLRDKLEETERYYSTMIEIFADIYKAKLSEAIEADPGAASEGMDARDDTRLILELAA